MSRLISMLRGINVAGARKIPMPELKALYEGLGYSNVVTYLQSGNVAFTCPEAGVDGAAARIERAIETRFGYSLPVFIRTAVDFHRLVDTNPFLTGRREDPAWLHVTFLYHSPDPADISKLGSLAAAGEEFAPAGDQIFLFCPHGYGRTKLSNTAIEQRLKTPATTRNWNTVQALLKLSGGEGS